MPGIIFDFHHRPVDDTGAQSVSSKNPKFSGADRE